MTDDTIANTLLSLYQNTASNQNAARVLLIADESFDTALIPAFQHAIPQLQVITNRYDVAQQCEPHDLPCQFNDFASLTPQGFDYCLFRVSKERAVCHHIFNQSLQFLAPSGQILIGGKKNEGIKSYQQALVKTLGFNGLLKKNGNNYMGAFVRPEKTDGALEDKQYSDLRPILLKNSGKTIQSKPGLFGWNKEDQGSAMLMDWFKHALTQPPLSKANFTQALDLGCGYGYLSLRLLHARQLAPLASLQRLYATDNNAAAIQACTRNLAESPDAADVNITVQADNCGEGITERFDLILCNPPFHQGFDNSRDLTQRFLTATKRLLTKDGIALFVVNQFIPLEQLASKHFSRITCVYSDRSFKLVQVQR